MYVIEYSVLCACVYVLTISCKQGLMWITGIVKKNAGAVVLEKYVNIILINILCLCCSESCKLSKFIQLIKGLSYSKLHFLN